MRDHIGTIREFKTKNFRVVVDADYDYDTDLSFDDTGEVRGKLESGEYVAFQVKAAVYMNGAEVGVDYLGGCIYSDISEFQDHRACGKYNAELAAKGETARCGSYFKDMIHSAISEARKHVKTMQGVHIRG